MIKYSYTRIARGDQLHSRSREVMVSSKICDDVAELATLITHGQWTPIEFSPMSIHPDKQLSAKDERGAERLGPGSPCIRRFGRRSLEY